MSPRTGFFSGPAHDRAGDGMWCLMREFIRIDAAALSELQARTVRGEQGRPAPLENPQLPAPYLCLPEPSLD